MGSRDSILVPPPSWFGQVLHAGIKDGRDVESFPTILDAIDYINALTGAAKPAEDNLYTILAYPNIYLKRHWIPDYVNFVPLSPLSSIFIGEIPPAVPADEYVISMGISNVSNPLILSNNFSGIGSAIWMRNTTSAYTIHQEDFGSIGAGDTLEVTPSGFSKETITFAGTETTAQNVTDAINAQATNFEAIFRYKHVELRHINDNGDKTLTVHKEGTANVALGFSISEDTVRAPSTFEWAGINHPQILGDDTEKGIHITDRGGGIYSIINPTVGGCVHGIYAEDGASTHSIIDLLILFNTNGLTCEGQFKLTVLSGIFSNALDLNLAATTVLNFSSVSYKSRNGGTIVPSGSRITHEFKLNGGIAVQQLLDGERVMPFDATIESVSIWRGVAGGGGQTTINLFKRVAGVRTAIFDPGDEPFIASSEGDYVSKTVDVSDGIQISQHDSLSVDITTKEIGNPMDLSIVVTAEVH